MLTFSAESPSATRKASQTSTKIDDVPNDPKKAAKMLTTAVRRSSFTLAESQGSIKQPIDADTLELSGKKAQESTEVPKLTIAGILAKDQQVSAKFIEHDTKKGRKK
jgi:hypothetical protein